MAGYSRHQPESAANMLERKGAAVDKAKSQRKKLDYYFCHTHPFTYRKTQNAFPTMQVFLLFMIFQKNISAGLSNSDPKERQNRKPRRRNTYLARR